jgi:hypothetical protein
MHQTQHIYTEINGQHLKYDLNYAKMKHKTALNR